MRYQCNSVMSEIDDIFKAKSKESRSLLLNETSSNTHLNASTCAPQETMESIGQKVKQSKLIIVNDKKIQNKQPKLAYKDGFGDSRGDLHTNRSTEDGLRLFHDYDLKIGQGEGGK